MATSKWEHIIKEDGTVVTTVLERGDVECSVVQRQATNNLGRELSHERTGPECDDVHEVQY
jgi:hypothetical protein